MDFFRESAIALFAVGLLWLRRADVCTMAPFDDRFSPHDPSIDYRAYGFSETAANATARRLIAEKEEICLESRSSWLQRLQGQHGT